MGNIKHNSDKNLKLKKRFLQKKKKKKKKALAILNK
jgi:hypothetical protein